LHNASGAWALERIPPSGPTGRAPRDFGSEHDGRESGVTPSGVLFLAVDDGDPDPLRGADGEPISESVGAAVDEDRLAGSSGPACGAERPADGC